MIIECPLPAALKAIPLQSCPFNFDQIVRMFLQRRQPSDTPPFAALADIQTLLDWTTLKAAVDSTKVVTTPVFTGLVIPQSEPLKSGGNDNDTFAGIPEYNGEGTVTVTGNFKKLAPASKRAMDYLSQESLASAVGLTNLTAYLVNRDGYIFAVNPAPGEVASTNYFGIPIFNFRVGSVGSEGLNAANRNGFSFDLMPNWADYLVSIKPAFDPLADL